MAPLYPSFTETYHHDRYPAIDPTQPALDCSGKIIIVTGGGQGIGQAIAIAFAQAHAKGIALIGRTASKLSETAKLLEETSPQTNVFHTTADITSQSQVQTALDATVAHFGAVPDVLVNNAGGATGFAHLVDADIEDVWRCFELNTKGPLIVAQAFLRAHRAGAPDADKTIVNISTGGAHLPYFPTGAAYCVSKAAAAKLMEYIHFENPTCNVFNLQPGVVESELSRGAGRKAPDSPRLPAGLSVWLATRPEARELSGRFLWSNWDITEVLARKEEISSRGLLLLTLKGWAEEQSEQDLIARATSVQKGA